MGSVVTFFALVYSPWLPCLAWIDIVILGVLYYSAYDYRARRKFMHTQFITQDIRINARPERVWQALTDPKQLEAWFSPGAAWEIPSLEVGGQAIWHSSENETDVHSIEVVEPPHRFALRWLPEQPATPLLTTYTLEEENGKTHLTVTETGYELLPEEERQKRMESGKQGYAQALKSLKDLIEGDSTQ